MDGTESPGKLGGQKRGEPDAKPCSSPHIQRLSKDREAARKPRNSSQGTSKNTGYVRLMDAERDTLARGQGPAVSCTVEGG